MALTIDGEAVRRIRIQRELSQNDLALEADISVSIISKIENGKNPQPKLQTIEKIAGVLEVTEDQIMVTDFS